MTVESEATAALASWPQHWPLGMTVTLDGAEVHPAQVSAAWQMAHREFLARCAAGLPAREPLAALAAHLPAASGAGVTLQTAGTLALVGG